MTKQEYIKAYDAIDTTHPDSDDGSISMFATRATAANLRIMVCQKYIKSLEARIAKLESLLKAQEEENAH